MLHKALQEFTITLFYLFFLCNASFLTYVTLATVLVMTTYISQQLLISLLFTDYSTTHAN